MFVLFHRCRTAQLILTRGRFRQAPMPSDRQGALGCAVAQISDSIFKQPTVLGPSLRANGSRERAPDDRLREAIHAATWGKNGLLRRFRLRSMSYGGQVAPRNDV